MDSNPFGQFRYNSLNLYYRKTFGKRVHKISIDAGFTCPVRDGTIGSGGCIYCDSSGSAAAHPYTSDSVKQQVEKGITFCRRWFKTDLFIAYFQAFSNTYAPLQKLKSVYEEALGFPEIAGLAIGTRPDCISEETARYLKELSEKTNLWLELGLQSIHDRSLQLIRRGHTFQQFAEALDILKGADINICVHVILGLPGESRDDMEETVNKVTSLNVQGIKFHSLYILKNTGIEEMYNQGKVALFSEDDYIQFIIKILEKLSPEIVVQRLFGETAKDKLIAPDWILKKNIVLQKIRRIMKEHNTWQGKLFKE